MPRIATLAESLAVGLRRELAEQDAKRDPFSRFVGKPVEFFRNVLGIIPTPEQAEIAIAVVEHDQTATRSGQKCGKSTLAVCLALYWYCVRPKARVMMTANSKAQVGRVLWKELKSRINNSLIPIPGVLAKNPETGLQHPDGREIIAVTARQIEGMAGFSGDVFLVVDEASGISRKMWEAIVGNMAGGGKIFAISNPTTTDGPFFDAFHTKKEFWRVFHLNSEDVARWQLKNKTRIAGLASWETIERWREEYGIDSVFYRMRVLGEFILNESGKPITLEMIAAAQDRHEDEPENGPVSIGIDVAGAGSSGDEWAFAILRGRKQVALFAFSGLTEDAALEHARAFAKTYRAPDGSLPQIKVDAEGPIGASFYGRLKGIGLTLENSRPDIAFEVFPVRASLPAAREFQHYERRRDELFANLAKWLETGAILKDVKQEVELNAPSWIVTLKGKLKLTPKDELREKLGRSPDRADALALAAWQPMGYEMKTPRDENEQDEPPPERDGFIDPYAGWSGHEMRLAA